MEGILHHRGPRWRNQCVGKGTQWGSFAPLSLFPCALFFSHCHLHESHLPYASVCFQGFPFTHKFFTTLTPLKILLHKPCLLYTSDAADERK